MLAVTQAPPLAPGSGSRRRAVPSPLHPSASAQTSPCPPTYPSTYTGESGPGPLATSQPRQGAGWAGQAGGQELVSWRPVGKEGPSVALALGARTPIGARGAVCTGGISLPYHTSCFQPAARTEQGWEGRGPPPWFPGLRVFQGQSSQAWGLMGLLLPTSLLGRLRPGDPGQLALHEGRRDCEFSNSMVPGR